MDVILVIIVIIFLYLLQRGRLIRRIEELNRFDRKTTGGEYIDLLFIVHFLLFIVYFSYVQFERSDSRQYWAITAETENWFTWWGQDTYFINFITWPFSHFLGLSYPSCMIIFSFFGFQGGVLFYLAAKENIKGLPLFYKSYTVLELVFLLPNIHFWSSSVGKGAVMLCAIGMIIYGLSRFQNRFLLILIGAWLVYMIRGHILFLIILGAGTGLLFTLKGIKWYYKTGLILIAVVVGTSILGDMSKYTGSNSLDLSSSAKFQKRAVSNSTATSGVDIANYNQAQKLFTFWYRPLFVDAPGFLGIVVSFENMLYVFFTINIIRYGLRNWKKWNGWFRISLFIFIYGSFALAQIAGNLGIAMRQKAQIMPLFFIVYCKSMTYKGMRKRNG
jgi:hypothetical protein